MVDQTWNMYTVKPQGITKKRSPKTGGLLTQAHFSEKCTSGGLKGRSLNKVVLRTGLINYKDIAQVSIMQYGCR